MTFAFINIRSGARVPAEMISNGASSVTSDTSNTVYKCILINLNIRAVQYHYSMITIDKYISCANCTFGNFKEKSIGTRPELVLVNVNFIIPHSYNIVINKTSIDITNVIPDTV